MILHSRCAKGRVNSITPEYHALEIFEMKTRFLLHVSSSFQSLTNLMGWISMDTGEILPQLEPIGELRDNVGDATRWPLETLPKKLKV